MSFSVKTNGIYGGKIKIRSDPILGLVATLAALTGDNTVAGPIIKKRQAGRK